MSTENIIKEGAILGSLSGRIDGFCLSWDCMAFI